MTISHQLEHFRKCTQKCHGYIVHFFSKNWGGGGDGPKTILCDLQSMTSIIIFQQVSFRIYTKTHKIALYFMFIHRENALYSCSFIPLKLLYGRKHSK